MTTAPTNQSDTAHFEAVQIDTLPRHSMRGPLLLGLGFIISIAAWAFWPLHEQTPAASTSLESLSKVQAVDSTLPPLNLAAFRTPIWIAPPPPLASPAPAVLASNTPVAPPLPPFTAQLLAIARLEPVSDTTHTELLDNTSTKDWEAIFYDPTVDRIVHAKPGEIVCKRLVKRVTATAVVISESVEIGTRKQNASPPQPGANPAGFGARDIGPEKTIMLREPPVPIPGLTRAAIGTQPETSTLSHPLGAP